VVQGAGLSACIIDADLGTTKTIAMITIFSVTTSFGIALGIGISSVYDPSSLTSCLVQGEPPGFFTARLRCDSCNRHAVVYVCLATGAVNAFAAGILIYLTLVDMVAEEFGKREVSTHTARYLVVCGQFCSE
jgi:zinc transporter 1/2/3